MKNFLVYLFAFSLIMLSFFLGRVFEASLDNTSIQENINKSILQLEKEGEYPQFLFSSSMERYKTAYAQIDTVTELTLLNSAYVNNNKEPIYSAVANSTQGDASKIGMLRQISEKQHTSETSVRPQYWWGSLSIIRPALTQFTYIQIREISMFVFFLFFSLIIVLLAKKIGGVPAMAFAIGMASSNMIMVPVQIGTSMAFFATFFIMALILFTYPQRQYIQGIMLLSGCLTAYFDWLSTPIISFVLPMIVILCIAQKNQVKDIIQTPYRFFCKLSGIWCCGYLFTHLTKWLLASIIMKKNIFDIALDRVESNNSRIVDWGPSGTGEYIVEAIKSNFLCLFPINILNQNNWNISWFILGAFLFFISAFLFFRKKGINFNFSFLLILTGLSPYVWFTVFKAHSYIHHWFTYRSQSGTIMAIIIAYFSFVDFGKYNKDKIRKLLSNNESE